jgi:hypothetical protein
MSSDFGSWMSQDFGFLDLLGGFLDFGCHGVCKKLKIEKRLFYLQDFES